MANKITDRETPLCSVCIANFNGENILADCIDSVLKQQGSIPMEIIVHDDASTDGSMKLLREKFPDVITIESTENVGFCISNNRMADIARGKYILLLNNDAALHSDALLTLLQHSLRQKRQGILTLPQYDWECGELVNRGCFIDPFYNSVPNFDYNRQNVAMVMASCLWIPRRLWHKLGGFPEWMGSIAEDLYLCCLARLYGYTVQVTRYSGYRHWQGLSFSGKRENRKKLVSTYRRRALSERNKTMTMLITYPACILMFVFPLHIIFLGFESILVALLKSGKNIILDVYLQVPLSVWKLRKKIIQLRHNVQTTRDSTKKEFLSKIVLVPWKLKMLLQFGLPQVR